ncbi:GAF domain-containing protein [Variovorax sp. J31P207]|uniref:GAF domain-containing protein n=1 Tax=Variovorax sp. J31P207 TaxID=3053510 RepID=UPI002577A524|nr:GAF domain-containing protein [Variovorax sp. J31P207]MDM0066647.1 GAF domain-containing protein [Variovorax sp. J31P207]
MDLVRSIDAVSQALATGGISAALAYLNANVPHRYTAVYRLDGPFLHNAFLHDKELKRRPAYLAVIPFDQSYCQFVVRDGFFRTDDSAADLRLKGHPYQGLVVSYHSVPLLGTTGKLWGTLSHFDVKKHPLSDEEFELLRGAAQLLPGYLIER